MAGWEVGSARGCTQYAGSQVAGASDWWGLTAASSCVITGGEVEIYIYTKFSNMKYWCTGESSYLDDKNQKEINNLTVQLLFSTDFLLIGGGLGVTL